jgi:hypothetical protein
MEETNGVLDHFERRACSAQWLAFNRGMAAELAAGLPPEDLHQLFFRIGENVARTFPVPPCASLAELEAEFNARWDGIDWGYSTLREEADGLRIRHACSPLAMAFGPESTGWSSGFFEGVYQTWFGSQRLPAALRVQALPSHPQPGAVIELRLARSSP